ncbi:17863_t:CDS:2 [Entrophospora sp. SA101]|nr:17863_t:CDS:2 [Entrophospora sp. SA101]
MLYAWPASRQGRRIQKTNDEKLEKFENSEKAEKLNELGRKLKKIEYENEKRNLKESKKREISRKKVFGNGEIHRRIAKKTEGKA